VAPLEFISGPFRPKRGQHLDSGKGIPCRRPIMIYYVALPFVLTCRRRLGARWHGSPKSGEYDAAVILKTFGEVPHDFDIA